MSTGSSALPQIIALGGHSITANEEDAALSRYILDQVAAERPRICFLSQGSGEDAFYIANFYRHFLERNALPSDLSLFKPHTADIASFLLDQDIIYVGGGNTKSMLALWREWGVDRVLRQAWQQGVLLSGSARARSAGSSRVSPIRFQVISPPSTASDSCRAAARPISTVRPNGGPATID